MNQILKYKIEFAFAPLAVIVISAIAACAVLGFDLFWKASAFTLALYAAKPAAEALWSVWTAGSDDDGDEGDLPQHGAPVSPADYAPVLH